MFPFIVLLSALLLASCAAFFSVTGIAQVFSGASLSVGVMAAAIELAKIVGVSALYRYSKDIPRKLKAYMWTGTFIIMLITSFGIYGYLGNAYATSATDIREKENQISLYTTQQNSLTSIIQSNTDRIGQLQAYRTQQEIRSDSLIGRTGFVTQQRVVQQADIDIRELQNQTTELIMQRDSLELIKSNTLNSITSTGKLGTFYYLAQTLNVPLDTIIKWFILVLVFVFDPMSISLFLVYNVIVKQSKDKNQTKVKFTLNNLTKKLNGDESDIASNTDLPITESISEFNESTIESNIPYYMQPGFDWNSDTKWQSDPNAVGYKKNFGVSS